MNRNIRNGKDIAVEGQERADRYYLSSLKVSNAESEVDDTCFNVIKSEVAEKGYALVDEVIQRARRIIGPDKYKPLLTFENIRKEIEEERIFRQRYDRAFKKFTEHKKAKAEQIGMVYRQIRKEDREAMNIPPEVTCWIITKA